jgi:hypothetical protein
MQQQRIKNILIGLVVLGLALLAVLGPQYLPKFTKLHMVFDSPINMGLVAVLVVLIALFDVKLGVAFAFLVLMFAVYLMDEKNTQKIETFFANALAKGVPQTPLATGMVATTGQGMLGQQEFAAPRVASIRLNPVAEPVITTPIAAPGTEGFEDTTTTTESLNKTNTTNKIETATTNTSLEQQDMNYAPLANHAQQILTAGANQKAPACATPQQYDFLTQQVPGDMQRINGFDVAGCRYDLASRPQNLTVYGPPLSWCGTYDQQQTAKCGTVFYPLHG